MSTESLAGDDVINADGEDLGEIAAIMLDVPKGRIAYAVLSFGGFMGTGDKLFAVPWEALTLDADRECFVLSVEKERLAHAQVPEVVLLDIGLPDMDGYEVAKILRAKMPRTLLVALTGMGRDEDRHRSRDAGFDHHLVKPVAFEELSALLA